MFDALAYAWTLRAGTSDDPAQQERVREKTHSRTRTRTAIDPSNWVNELLEFGMRFPTSNHAAQINQYRYEYQRYSLAQRSDEGRDQDPRYYR